MTFNDFADFIGIAGAGVSVAIWLRMKAKEKFNEQRIKIQLKMPTFIAILPGEIERKHLTRSELQGLLGILPMNTPGARYQLSFLNTPNFFANLKAAQDDEHITSIEIVCIKDENKDEIAQFDLDKIRQQCTITEII